MSITAWIIIGIIIYLIICDSNKSRYKNSTNINLDSNLPPYNIRYQKNEAELLREHVFRKYNYKCNECGSHNMLQIHHLLEVQYGGKDRIDNMILLCENCHQKKHGREFTYNDNSKRKTVKNETFAKLQKLRHAQGNKNISIVYEKKDGSVTKREIEPKEIYENDNRLYVKAYCYLRNAKRIFRISRIKNIE
jgi:hypothetical protein